MQVSLLGLEHSDGCLSLLILRLLGHVIALHLLFGCLNISRQRVANVRRLARQVLLQFLLLRAESLDLAVIEIELFGEGLGGLLEASDFALERCIELLVSCGSSCLIERHTKLNFISFNRL